MIKNAVAQVVATALSPAITRTCLIASKRAAHTRMTIG
jgi:hypothetical protein